MLLEQERLTAAPTLIGERIIMRAHKDEDFEACCALWADPEVVRYISGKPSTPTDTWGRLLKYAGHWSLSGFGYWAVIEKESGELVGDVGFADFKRDITPSLEGKAEAGWVLSPKFHGRGYGQEAVELGLSWLNKSGLFPEVHCIIAPENKASVGLAERVGFKKYANGAYLGEPTVFLSMPLS
ncbi:Acetyltransferase (GNAT) family protein [Pseudovibrio axinellae]|uniref:Acetyltransferase (GNAT) family protein n=1 Tax=Pseudovibrio axinellae TaxID=989403 RepID=A0A161XCB9_9HYPH|nr:GNAT family N-acetyltransferase [Pseudovibrio axinellae]KZL08478.1 Acetyltransferase (GNAT) family protein [Pseudovibrio axinellae]SEP75417.1 Protein N-acetyltransferase, RimJ/RimL family [Pseudovibrio axinellae]